MHPSITHRRAIEHALITGKLNFSLPRGAIRIRGRRLYSISRAHTSKTVKKEKLVNSELPIQMSISKLHPYYVTGQGPFLQMENLHLLFRFLKLIEMILASFPVFFY